MFGDDTWALEAQMGMCGRSKLEGAEDRLLVTQIKKDKKDP